MTGERKELSRKCPRDAGQSPEAHAFSNGSARYQAKRKPWQLLVVVLRATQKVLRLLAQSEHSPSASDTALGDWYANRIVIARQPLLLLVSQKSLLSILTPARDVKQLPERLPEIVGARLRRLDMDETVIAAEVEAMNVVVVAETTDRSVTGQMVDFAKHLTYYLPEKAWSEADLQAAEGKLAKMPCRSSRPFDQVIFPLDATLRLLANAWSADGVRH